MPNQALHKYFRMAAAILKTVKAGVMQLRMKTRVRIIAFAIGLIGVVPLLRTPALAIAFPSLVMVIAACTLLSCREWSRRLAVFVLTAYSCCCLFMAFFVTRLPSMLAGLESPTGFARLALQSDSFIWALAARFGLLAVFTLGLRMVLRDDHVAIAFMTQQNKEHA